jgi:Zn-dependent protease
VFLLEPGRTQFDLNWRLGSIPVRIHPMFWVISVFLGWNEREDGWQFVAVWVACVFVSILVHEMGHVLMGQAFGTQGHIVLYSFGGLAVGSNALSNRWQRIAVSFAGPLAGFLLLGVLLLALAVFAPDRFAAAKYDLLHRVGLWGEEPPVAAVVEILRPSLFGRAIEDLILINLFWGLVNLLPIFPLDGGQISRELLTWVSPANGLRGSLALSGIVAGVLAANAASIYFAKRPLIPHLNFGDGYLAIFFGLLALQSLMAMQQVPRGSTQGWQRREDYEERQPWERDPDYWKSGRGDPYD